MIRVVLADDQAVVRDGLALLLSASDDIDVLAAAADGTEALARVVELLPDVALLDLRMPGLDGAQVAAALATEAPGVRVLILTTYADDGAILPALPRRGCGYLTKDASGEQLVGAIRDVAAGRTVLDPDVQRRLVELLRAEPAPVAPPGPAPAPPAGPSVAGPSVAGPSVAGPSTGLPEVDGLTRREVDVVRLVAGGLTNRQIARHLVLSEATVKTHLNHVLAKLDVDGRPGLIAWAWRNGLGGA